jgi:hypothetical protein
MFVNVADANDAPRKRISFGARTAFAILNARRLSYRPLPEQLRVAPPTRREPSNLTAPYRGISSEPPSAGQLKGSLTNRSNSLGETGLL